MKEGILKIGKVVKEAYQIVASKCYRDRYKEVTAKDPLVCPTCNKEMELSKIWLPKHGAIYDLMDALPTVDNEIGEMMQKTNNSFAMEIPHTVQLSFSIFV